MLKLQVVVPQGNIAVYFHEATFEEVVDKLNVDGFINCVTRNKEDQELKTRLYRAQTVLIAEYTPTIARVAPLIVPGRH
jgi:hypothetical protein